MRLVYKRAQIQKSWVKGKVSEKKISFLNWLLADEGLNWNCDCPFEFAFDYPLANKLTCENIAKLKHTLILWLYFLFFNHSRYGGHFIGLNQHQNLFVWFICYFSLLPKLKFVHLWAVNWILIIFAAQSIRRHSDIICDEIFSNEIQLVCPFCFNDVRFGKIHCFLNDHLSLVRNWCAFNYCKFGLGFVRIQVFSGYFGNIYYTLKVPSHTYNI